MSRPLHNGGVGAGHGGQGEGHVGALLACLGARVVVVPHAALERCGHVSLRAPLEHGRSCSVVTSAREEEVGIPDTRDLLECPGVMLRASHKIL